MSSRALPLSLAALPLLAQAQTELSVFTATGRGAATAFVTDYQAIGINPANLAWPGRYPDKHLAFGLVEGSYSLRSEALTKDDLRKRLLRVDRPFTREEKLEAARKLADAGLVLNADVMLAGVSYRTDAVGGLGFQVRDRAQWASTFSPVAAQLLFLGSSASYFDLVVLASGDTIANDGQLSEATVAQVVQGLRTNPQRFSRVLDGSRIAMNWYREFGFSYGRVLARTDAVDLYAGAGLKYLLGIGIVDVTAEDGSFDAFTSLSPYFDIDFGEAAANTRRVTGRDALLPKAVGRGFGLDLGVSAIVRERWKAGIAVTDLGAITWNGNAYSANDALLTDLTTDGLEDYDVFTGLDDIVSTTGILQWQGKRERTVRLPSTLRVGGGYLITPILEAGVDVVLPLNDVPGSYDGPVFAVGGDVRPVPWVQLSAGVVACSDQRTKLPAGITFNVAKGTWEFGVASRDIISSFSPTAPTLSLAIGFLRFRV